MRLAVALLILALGCQDHRGENEAARLLQRMVDQDRCAADDPSSYFRNGACNQAPPEGVRSYHAGDAALDTGRDEQGRPLSAIPLRVDRALIEQGKGRFELFCATCHGLLGDGQSEVAENMRLKRPPALFEPTIQELPDGQLFRIISEGYGLMPSYARSLTPEQRWAVVAYVRVLALSQRMPLAALTPQAREEAQRWLR
jgi:mono/diheme cytochrome c family protein